MTTQETDSAWQVAQDIAKQLQEENPLAIMQIRGIVEAIGIERAQSFLQETLTIEQNGGMMTAKGDRRRTPGGVFLYIVRRQCKEARHIWYQPAKKQKKSATPPIKQSESKPRNPEVQAPHNAMENYGKPLREQQKGTTVKITLIGRPASKIAEKEGHVALVLQATKVPALPKGLPAPATEPTNYVCFIANKQWKNVSEAIKDEQDALIIEGFPQIDLAKGTIKVFATNVTTRNMQKAKYAKTAEDAQG